MIAPTPQPAAASAEAQTVRDERASPPAKERPTTPDWRSAESRARELLELLGRGDHPDAEGDPIHALYQVAIDYRCSAHGYRELYLHHRRHAAD